MNYLEEQFKKSLEYFKVQKYIESEKILLKILKNNKSHENVFFLLGLIKGINKDNLNAIKYLKQAIKINPKKPLFHYNIALTYSQINKDTKAESHYKKSLKLDDKNVEAWVNYGNILKKQNKFNDSIVCFKRALLVKPNYDLALMNIALAYFNIENVKRGMKILKNIPKASKIYSQIQTTIAFGHLLIEEYDKGLILSNKLIKNNSNNFTALANRGIIFIHLNKFKEAINDFSLILKMNPNNVEALSNIALAQKGLGYTEKSLQNLNKAIKINPLYIEAYCIKAGVYIDLHNYDESKKNFQKAIVINKNYPEANFGLGLNYLINLEFEKGWEYFNWRFRVKRADINRFITNKKEWDGKNLNKKLFIWGEQGLGDHIMFSSLLGELKDYPKQIVIFINEKLIKLFSRSFHQFIFIGNIEEIDNYQFDEHLPLASLGKLFRKNINDFKKNKSSFLIDNSLLTEKFKSKIITKKIKCGLSWKSINKDVGSSKSINIKQLEPVFSSQKFKLINLQFGEITNDINFIKKNFKSDFEQFNNIDLFEDIESVASLIQSCDIVITCSNSTAHLAGALGKETYLLIPLSRGKLWYWTDIKGASYWYPKIYIFKQIQFNSWKEPIEKMLKMIDIKYNQLK